MNNIDNAIGYSGSVRAYLSAKSRGQVEFKNSGLKPLLDMLAKAVLGYDISLGIPDSLCIYARKDDNSENDMPLLLYPIKLVGKVWGDVIDKNENHTSVRFTAIVTSSDRSNMSSVGTTTVIKLLDKTGEIALAEIKDNANNDLATIHDSMTEGVDAVYEWTLKFTNIGTAGG